MKKPRLKEVTFLSKDTQTNKQQKPDVELSQCGSMVIHPLHCQPILDTKMPLGRCSHLVWLSCALPSSLALVRLQILFLASGARDLAV